MSLDSWSVFFYIHLFCLQNLLVGPESFSLGELAHAILIMTHYHALSSFALGCGVNPEIDSSQGHYYGDLSLLAPFCYQGNPALGVIGTTSDSEVTDSDVGFSSLNSSPAYPITTDKHFDSKYHCAILILYCGCIKYPIE